MRRKRNTGLREKRREYVVMNEEIERGGKEGKEKRKDREKDKRDRDGGRKGSGLCRTRECRGKKGRFVCVCGGGGGGDVFKESSQNA